eukprot:Gb_36264 [translate_table: standard]
MVDLDAALPSSRGHKVADHLGLRVEAMRELQDQHDELEAKFFEERAALEAKYQKLYEPFYGKHYEIVNGITELESAKEDKTEPDPKQENDVKEKGVPKFWLTAMKNDEVKANGKQVFAPLGFHPAKVDEFKISGLVLGDASTFEDFILWLPLKDSGLSLLSVMRPFLSLTNGGECAWDEKFPLSTLLASRFGKSRPSRVTYCGGFLEVFIFTLLFAMERSSNLRFLYFKP